ncbi:hypothetical protein CBR_g23722 [Chara braunii]|uniref:Uncharacterized protein n=1 Tax=Chara braunii TaxID=69332 RepID=A0A388L509_CHABU|nr:hypothetical protein CBR_g23722 [Chara braunii]|eukprot:GBG77391.1 hypothetical protein CBR_g23722 [Chara braunii]
MKRVKTPYKCSESTHWRIRPEKEPKKTGEGSSQQASKGKMRDGELTKMAAEMVTLKKHLEDMRSLKYEIASLKGSISKLKFPVVRQFISPRQLRNENGNTPAKKSTPKASGGEPSRIKRKTQQAKDPQKSARRSSARRRILQGKQLSEDMLSALQMEDLKQLCAMHKVRYRGMPQAKVALRKIPGLIISDTEDLLDKTETGAEAQGKNPDERTDNHALTAQAYRGGKLLREEASSSEEVDVELSEESMASRDVQPSSH